MSPLLLRLSPSERIPLDGVGGTRYSEINTDRSLRPTNTGSHARIVVTFLPAGPSIHSPLIQTLMRTRIGEQENSKSCISPTAWSTYLSVGLVWSRCFSSTLPSEGKRRARGFCCCCWSSKRNSNTEEAKQLGRLTSLSGQSRWAFLRLAQDNKACERSRLQCNAPADTVCVHTRTKAKQYVNPRP